MLLLGRSLLISARRALIQGAAPTLVSILALITTEHHRIGFSGGNQRSLRRILASRDPGSLQAESGPNELREEKKKAHQGYEQKEESFHRGFQALENTNTPDAL
jgi:predicted component of type VI protein secretion system